MNLCNVLIGLTYKNRSFVVTRYIGATARTKQILSQYRAVIFKPGTNKFILIIQFSALNLIITTKFGEISGGIVASASTRQKNEGYVFQSISICYGVIHILRLVSGG